MSPHRRLLILGTGTGVGKTFASSSLVRSLRAEGKRVLALKPIESGIDPSDPASFAQSDAAQLSAASGIEAGHCYALRAPISPHLAAAREDVSLNQERIVRWVEEQESRAESIDYTVIETAGGVFSPLSATLTNFDLALALSASGPAPSPSSPEGSTSTWESSSGSPSTRSISKESSSTQLRTRANALWFLLAPDSLGVLHDVSATLLACSALGRVPDMLVLSQAREPDASTGHNLTEIQDLVFPRLDRAAPRARVVPLVDRHEPRADDWAREMFTHFHTR